jgi:hypothetical protein
MSFTLTPMLIGRKKMEKKYFKSAVMAAMFCGLIATSASATNLFTIEFEDSAGDVNTFLNDAWLASPDAGSNTQTAAIYGAGFMMNAPTINFNANLWTWDSYSAPGSSTNSGYWDVFVVNLSQDDYYWNQTLSNPLTNSGDYYGGTPATSNQPDGISWFWGGVDYGAGGFSSGQGTNGVEQFWSDVSGGFISLSMPSYDPTKPVYVSVVLDTLTDPTDTNWASWGTFQVEVVPEPGTMLLFGTGIAAVAGIGRRKRK